MLGSFPVSVLVGTVLGFLSGLGIGGGSLLILWLTFILGMEYPLARVINLLFFIPAALISLYFRGKQGLIPWKTIFPAIISGCAFAFVSSFLGNRLDLHLLKKLFGALLILTGLRELTWHPKK